MTFSGIAAVQARIQEIVQQVGTLGPPGTTATAGSDPKTGADFASLLTDAMSTQSGAGALGGSAATTSAGGSANGELSSLLGQASALSGSDASGALAPTSPNSSSLSSLVSSLTGGGGSTASPDITSLLSSLTGAANGTATGTTGTAPSVTTQRFLDSALSQQGKPYVWGSTASASDPSPASFDCSELTKWAAARAGVTIPDGAAHQYVWLKQQGATMTVQQALQTPGALLFHFASEPKPGLGSEPPVAHVAISLGNGMTMEAKGHAYGTGIFQAGDRFNYAGMIPGM
jgi:cell wall-associated NlpC family hydrolase